MSSYTNGEWKANGIAIEADGLIIATTFVNTASRYIGKKEAEANAKIMAAASELLEALQMTLTVATQYGVHADHPEFLKARTVIKKATK